MLRGGRVVLAVRDLGKGVRFFTETLGMKLVSHAADVATIDAGDGFQIGLAHAATAVPGGVRIGLGSKLPLDEAIAVLENRGLVLTRTGDMATFDGPEGHGFFLYPC